MLAKKNFLITSGAYANAEITSDFGLLPTSFLPVGHRRLIELQLDLIKDFVGKKFITLPENYELLERDKFLLEQNKVKIHWVNPNLNLAEAILSFITALNLNGTSELYILHGDTSFKRLNYEPDLLYYGFTDLFYQWGQLNVVIGNNIHADHSKQPVLSGYFTFKNIPLFKKELEKSNSFEIALSLYNSYQEFKTVKGEGWLDFGHSNLYYKSKMELNVTRNFNRTVVRKNFINKLSSNCNKIRSEYSWFKQIPEHLSRYIPNVWNFKHSGDEASYDIEFIGAPTLQEKWVFGNLPSFVYYNVINEIFSLLSEMRKIRFEYVEENDAKNLLEQLYIKKTEERVLQFCAENSFNPKASIIINDMRYPSLEDFLSNVTRSLNSELSSAKETIITMMHGDLCFSNILTDTRSNTIKVIDPRGSLNTDFDAENNLLGDFRYDIAKFGHSLIGNYDYIVTGFYDLKFDLNSYKFDFRLENSSRPDLEEYFYSKVEEIGVSSDFIKASITNLFISMLPLHNEDKNRQMALLLNAYCFYYN